MVQKDTYNFEAKKEYRRLWKEFIKRQYPGEKERRGLRVACFPGHEGLEITEVYDPLGIRRDRIWGIEYDPEIAKQIQTLNLGINIYGGNALDFFRQVDERFNIINLDFQSRCKEKEREVMSSIVEYERTKAKFIFGSNFYASRESSAYQEAMKESTSFSPLKSVFKSVVEDKRIPAETRNIFDKLLQTTDIREKNEGFSNELESIRNKDLSLAICHHLVSNASPREILESLGKNLENYIDKGSTMTAEQIRANPEGYRNYLQRLRIADKYNLLSALEKLYPDLNEDYKKAIARYIDDQRSKNPRFIKDFFKGKYISDNGSPMFFDFLCITQRPDLFTQPRIEVTPIGDSSFEIPAMILPEHFERLYQFEVARTKLGEYHHAQRNEIQIKSLGEKVRADLSAGISENEVAKKYELTLMQLAGHKATLSRKNGNGKEYKNGQLYQPTEQEELEIKEFLASGIPYEEILSAYPKLTKHQLTARKAWITMSDKGKGDNNGRVTREQIFERDDYRCQYPNCGRTREQNIQESGHDLHEHHIDYNHDNNDPKNRIVLCTGHHAMTNTIQHGPKMKEVLEEIVKIKYEELEQKEIVK